MLNYPAKPWVNGQKFIQNGTVYTYDSVSKSWNFDKLTYNRLIMSMRFTVPVGLASFRIEFYEGTELSNLSLSLDSTNEQDWPMLFVFNGQNYQQLNQQQIKLSQFNSLFVIPKIDLNIRYFCRWKWSTMPDYSAVIYPAVGGGSGDNGYDDSELRTRITAIETYLRNCDVPLNLLAQELG